MSLLTSLVTTSVNIPQVAGISDPSIICATVGDSRLAKSWGSYYNKYGNGIVYWTEMLTRCRVRFPFALNFAVSGYTTPQSLPQAVLAAASTADIVLIFCDINDTTLRQAGSGLAITVAATLANIDTMVNQQLAAGKRVILFAGSPCGPTAGSLTEFSGNYLKQAMYIPQAIRDRYSRTKRVAVVDVWPTWGDMTTATGYANATACYDNIHPSATGDYYAAVQVAAIINNWFPPTTTDLLPGSQADLYDATNNPLGMLNPNGFMIGTSGTAGANSSGTFANSWTCTTSDAALSAVGSIVSSGGKRWQQIVVSGTPTTASPVVYLTQSDTLVANMTAGDTFYSMCELEVDATPANVYTPFIETRMQGSVNNISYSGLLGSSGHTDGLCPAFAYSGVMATPDLVAEAGFTVGSTRIGVYAVQNAAASLTFRVGRVAKRKRLVI